jgi:hypothetical protein
MEVVGAILESGVQNPQRNLVHGSLEYELPHPKEAKLIANYPRSLVMVIGLLP